MKKIIFNLITLIGIINFTYGWNPGNPTVNWRKAGSESINPVAEIPSISSVQALNNVLANRDRSTARRDRHKTADITAIAL